MELTREEKRMIPKAARYPLFLIGLVVLVIGEILAEATHASLDASAVIAVFGCLFLVLSVALR